jgi:putative ATP-dependent endonuclease of the OLD family
MHLQHIHVENFRNLRSVDVWLKAGLNVLVGRNNTGKSTLLLAIRHALGPASARGDGALWLDEEDLYRGARGVSAGPIRTSLTFADLDPKQQAQFLEILDRGPDGQLSLARLHFEATWHAKKRRFHTVRWGGPHDGERVAIPNEILEALPITFLPALRNAEEALSPGNRSRLARLLEDYALEHANEEHQQRIEDIFEKANASLHDEHLISTVASKVRTAASGMAGSDYVPARICAVDPKFSRILRSLRIELEEGPIADLALSGLGYNNLLYIATVLAHLRESPEDEVPLLLIEEPEAHLHPQLTIRLGEYLAELQGRNPPQTLVTTHSPTLAANVRPSQILVQHACPTTGDVRCNSISRLSLTDAEERKLQRMLDVTRASLYFARGLILVEGISESLLVPALARRLGFDLSKHHISVVPICGVDFTTLLRVVCADGFGVRTAIITDGDPEVDGDTLSDKRPKCDEQGNPIPCRRLVRLRERLQDRTDVQVFASGVTLEYDLASAGEENPYVMVDLWEELVPRSRTLNRALLAQHPTIADRALAVWRGICLTSSNGSKAELAHRLTDWLVERPDASFAIPHYLAEAIRWVCPAEQPAAAMAAD